MIGPHETRELELMLAGKKHLAIFHDILQAGYISPEEIIPENAFSTYVSQGTISRLYEDFITPKGIALRFVCFTTQHNEWRAEAFFWLQKECLAGVYKFDSFYEFFIGRLLGYKDEDIEHFLKHSRSLKNAPLA